MSEQAQDSLSPPSDFALRQLQTEQATLLDCVDKLRSAGVGDHLNLPQLIVCGDQSSGKSSVLQAISRVKFPTKGTLCTRFATELVLRRAVNEKISVSIRPGGNLTEEETSRLSSFHGQLSSLSEFIHFKNVLRVEIRGPTQPHLTIVDLPGLIKPNDLPGQQKGATDVYKLVESYMKNSKSIILAVISGNNDIANQAVRELVFKYDPDGFRTLGVITKPDLLHEDPDKEREFIQLAKNKKTELKLGWHVVRNRKATEIDVSDEARDEEEKRFLSQGIWNTLPGNEVGAETLRTRLSKILSHRISEDLPALRDKMNMGIEECKAKLDILGEPRDTPEKQGHYLLGISRKFYNRTYAAINGSYKGEDGFFESAVSERFKAKRLRAIIHKLNQAFAYSMRKKGHRWQIKSDDLDGANPDMNTPNLFSDYRPGIEKTAPISRSHLVSKLAEQTEWGRGKELPGFPNPDLVSRLFQEQSKPWEHLASNHVESVSATIGRFITLAFEGVDETTYRKLHRKHLNKDLKGRKESAMRMLKEVLKIHKRGHLITYNTTFDKRKGQLNPDDNMLGDQQPNTVFNTPNNPSSRINLTQTKVQPLDRACEDVIDTMEKYYEITLEVFITNVTTLVIENCLIDELPNMFSEEVVSLLKNEELGSLVAESDGIRAERKWQEDKLHALKVGLEVFDEYVVPVPTFTESSDALNSPTSNSFPDSEAPPTPTRLAREQSPEDTAVNGLTPQRSYKNHERSPSNRSNRAQSVRSTPNASSIGNLGCPAA
ncbi:hypothetical protein AOQ84DRAFT_220322 [Glonium stellatum]|uniref:Uncharacterized protein n=1 Tax=Glonium stellatum TaxID=574774 RepID=A0A8E2F3E0_9PEZI|nr:hypothetical protein AOQ84DRAFT_220322 [Glonium stellatum]